MALFITTPAGEIPVVDSTTGVGELIGAVAVRFAFRRMHYTVEPGLYALGKPDTGSPVIVTANYKLTFDTVRGALKGQNLWILVLNTRGINVWCAAGKGTFGTGEIARMVKKTRLEEIVGHRRLILPQLGAPGVSAHRVKQLTGFSVVYGPVRITDLPAFLDNRMVATDSMRQVHFNMADRLKVIPVELVLAWPLIIVAFILSLLFFITGVVSSLVIALIPLLGALLAGIFAVPLLLPYIPVRSFVLKGLIAGTAWAIISGLVWGGGWQVQLMWLLLLPPVTAYLAFNFTGATTYTSPSGVKFEISRYTWLLFIWFLLGIAAMFTLIIRGILV